MRMIFRTEANQKGKLCSCLSHHSRGAMSADTSSAFSKYSGSSNLRIVGLFKKGKTARPHQGIGLEMYECLQSTITSYQLDDINGTHIWSHSKGWVVSNFFISYRQKL